MARVRRTDRWSSQEARARLGVTLFLIAAAGSFLLSIALWFTALSFRLTAKIDGSAAAMRTLA